ncbi:MAG: ribosome biogenesis GTPase Der [Dehalococcoidia bacterium]
MTSFVPLVAIVGRPNVGKSALFNRLTRSRRALVEPVPGTTRDRLYGEVEWRGRHLRIVDTGGLEGPDADPFTSLVRAQVEEAMEEADTVLFLIDGAEGLTAADRDIADLLRRSERPVLLVANKTDRKSARERVSESYELGIGDPVTISAYHGQGIGELLDRMLDMVTSAEEPAETDRLSLAIVGRPNVGKSSLLNSILGESRTIVSEIPGTTRDAIDTPFEFEGNSLLLVDTAGIRRRGRIEQGIERHSVQRAEAAIDRSDVVALVIDQAEPTAAQDTHIAGYVEEQAKGMMLVVNKWDLAERPGERVSFARRVDYRYRFVPWAPVLFTSALTGDRVRDVMEMAVHIGEVRKRRVSTSLLNTTMQRAMAEHAPPTIGHRRLKLMYVTQAEVTPPTFVFFVNDPELLHFAYRRYLENRLRSEFEFEGTAITMVFRHRSEDRHEAGT